MGYFCKKYCFFLFCWIVYWFFQCFLLCCRVYVCCVQCKYQTLTKITKFVPQKKKKKLGKLSEYRKIAKIIKDNKQCNLLLVADFLGTFIHMGNMGIYNCQMSRRWSAHLEMSFATFWMCMKDVNWNLSIHFSIHLFFSHCEAFSMVFIVFVCVRLVSWRNEVGM